MPRILAHYRHLYNIQKQIGLGKRPNPKEEADNTFRRIRHIGHCTLHLGNRKTCKWNTFTLFNIDSVQHVVIGCRACKGKSSKFKTAVLNPKESLKKIWVKMERQRKTIWLHTWRKRGLRTGFSFGLSFFSVGFVLEIYMITLQPDR